MPGTLESWWCETLLAAFFWLEMVDFMTYGHETLNKQHGKLVEEHPSFLIKRGAHSSETFLVTTSLILVDRARVVQTVTHLVATHPVLPVPRSLLTSLSFVRVAGLWL